MPLWFLAALGAAIGNAVHVASAKRLTRTLDPQLLTAGIFGSAGTLLLALSSYRGFPAVDATFWLAIAATVAINMVAMTISYEALRTTDISLVAPMQAFTPAFLLLTSFALLGERPGAPVIAGVLFTVIGSYVLLLEPRMRPLDPFRRLSSDKGVRLAFTTAALFSVSFVFDKTVAMHSDPYFGSAVASLSLGILSFVVAHLRGIRMPNAHRGLLLLIVPGLAVAVTLSCQNTALLLQLAAPVSAIKRLSILFAVLIGGFLFRETHLLQRLGGQ